MKYEVKTYEFPTKDGRFPELEVFLQEYLSKMNDAQLSKIKERLNRSSISIQSMVLQDFSSITKLPKYDDDSCAHPSYLKNYHIEITS